MIIIDKDVLKTPVLEEVTLGTKLAILIMCQEGDKP